MRPGRVPERGEERAYAELKTGEKQMREIDAGRITEVIERLCIEANEHLPEDVKCAIRDCRVCEDG